MKHITFTSNCTYKIAILIKDDYLSKNEMVKYYLSSLDIPHDDFIAFGLPNKANAKQAKEQLSKLLPHLHSMGTTTLFVCDSTFFKTLTKETKADSSIGYVKNCVIKGLEHIKVIYGINYGQSKYNPNSLERLKLALTTLENHYKGNHIELGSNIIHNEYYPETKEQKELFLNKLKKYPMITCDIETTGLKVGSKLYSIAFAWDKHNGGAFLVQSGDVAIIKAFFEEYKGHVIYHNATFDVKQIIFNCFMKHPTDYDGLLHGLHTMTKRIHDTKIIAYLATNSTAGNELSLKVLAHEYVGNYALDVKDVTKLPTDDLLRYNLIDTLATWYVFAKYYPIMLQDEQLDIYTNMMLPSLKTIIQIELIGLPMDMKRVHIVENQLNEIADKASSIIKDICEQLGIHQALRQMLVDKDNEKLKTKKRTLDDYKDYFFNPNSNPHLSYLLYDHLGLPVINYTKTKQPSTDGATIEALINHTDDEQVKELLSQLLVLSGVNKILSAFIPSFKEAMGKDNHHYLMGSFNIGGTLSGRLSSSKPNLQQLPSGSEYGELIKTCFKAPDGWLFVGADFASLEDRINALLTKDENKLKVYTDGFDGHCLRAYYYWGSKMPTVEQSSENEQCYQLTMSDKIIYFKGSDVINYQNKKYTGDEFYELVTN